MTAGECRGRLYEAVIIDAGSSPSDTHSLFDEVACHLEKDFGRSALVMNSSAQELLGQHNVSEH